MSYEPYNVPHDQERAGLRDYCRRPPGGTSAPSVLWFVVLVAFVLGFLLGTTAHAGGDQAPEEADIRWTKLLEAKDCAVRALLFE